MSPARVFISKLKTAFDAENDTRFHNWFMVMTDGELPGHFRLQLQTILPFGVLQWLIKFADRTDTSFFVHHRQINWKFEQVSSSKTDKSY